MNLLLELRPVLQRCHAVVEEDVDDVYRSDGSPDWNVTLPCLRHGGSSPHPGTELSHLLHGSPELSVHVKAQTSS